MGPVAGLILVLLAAVPAIVGVEFIHTSDDLLDIVLGALLVVLSAFVIAGGILLAALGSRANVPDHVWRSLTWSVSISLGVGLVTGGWFFFILAVKLLALLPSDLLWSGAFLTLGVVSCALGTLSIFRGSKAGAWQPAPEPEIIIPEYQEDLPLVPPEPDLHSLLHLKKRLKEQGRT